MSVNSINPTAKSYFDAKQTKIQETRKVSKNYLQENCLDSVELSKKQSGVKSFFKGLAGSMGLLIPFLGSHIIGKIATNQQEAAEIVKDLKDGDIDYKTEKKDAGSKIAKGTCSFVLTCIPFVGTYLVGKHKYERENLVQDIKDIKDGKEIKNHEKKGVVRTYFKGVWENIKMIIPFYGTYYFGKEAAIAQNLNTDAKNISKALAPNSVEVKK